MVMQGTNHHTLRKPQGHVRNDAHTDMHDDAHADHQIDLPDKLADFVAKKHHDNKYASASPRDKKQREQGIVRASYVGIVGNVVLVIFKSIVGIAANSIAIILDAVNNATDVLSSVITIIGTKLAGRRADREHPFGYGRIEYMTSLVIALIILAAAVMSMRESVEKILHPAITDYGTITLIVIIASIVAKIFIGWYLTRKGKEYDSGALYGSGIDSNYDAILTGGTLVAALAALWFDVNIDGIVGVIISLFVFKAGFDVLKDAVSPIIGERGDDALGRSLKKFITSYDGVLGAYDLILDNFGPNEIIGSAHIEVEDNMNACAISELTRRISEDVYKHFGILITLGIYATNTTGKYAPIHAMLRKLVVQHPGILGTHGFYVDSAANVVNFDLVVDFKEDDSAIRDEIIAKMQQAYPQFSYNVMIDRDYLD